jgi:cytochrome c-type protein NapB
VYKIININSKFVAFAAMAALALAGMAALSLPVSQEALAQQASGVESLRGATSIPDDNAAPESVRQDTPDGTFERAYRQQPPLIPHKIDGYQIDQGVNQCIQCHDWPYNVDQGAPKISETHYTNRDGVALDEVSRSRWFCNQCHVPQSNARELVSNDFKSALDVK